VREEVSMPYSMDLRTRVLRDWDAGMRAEEVAAKYSVSRAWVHRLQPRRRETGSITPRKQTRWRTPILTPDLPRLEALIAEQPDRTLAELQHTLGTSASVTTIWRAIERLAITIKKNGTRVRTGSRRRRRGPDGLAPPDPGDGSRPVRVSR
jgi:transposase